MKALQIEISSFSELRTGGYLYVDKTEHIYNLLASKKKFVFLARPRRFGKSLLVSTLAELFQRIKSSSRIFGSHKVHTIGLHTLSSTLTFHREKNEHLKTFKIALRDNSMTARYGMDISWISPKIPVFNSVT